MFSKKPAPRSGTNLPVKAMGKAGGATFSVIGADVVITGNIRASADLHVDGTVDGDIACASLVQGGSSKVTGAIVAESARLAGMVKGAIVARNLVILQSARNRRRRGYDALTIEQGAQVEGRFSHREETPVRQPEPAKRADGEPKLAVAR